MALPYPHDSADCFASFSASGFPFRLLALLFRRSALFFCLLPRLGLGSHSDRYYVGIPDLCDCLPQWDCVSTPSYISFKVADSDVRSRSSEAFVFGHEGEQNRGSQSNAIAAGAGPTMTVAACIWASICP